MESIKDAYREVDEYFLECYPPPQSSWRRQQYYIIWSTLKDLIRDRSLSDELSPDEYEKRLRETTEFLTRLQIDLQNNSESPARADEDEQHIWTHPEWLDLEKYLHAKTPAFNDHGRFMDLDRLAAQYLARLWMQHEELDWILLDALIFSEISAYSRAIWGKREFEKFMHSTFDFRMWMFCCYTLAFLVPAIIIAGLYHYGYLTAMLVFLVLYTIYLLIVLIRLPKGLRESKEERLKPVELLFEMIKAYMLCSPPVVNPTLLLKRLNETIEKEVVYRNAVFSLLDRIIARDPTALLPFEDRR
jgi:hypothetical protein